MPDGIGYRAPVSGSNADVSTQRMNESERSEGSREGSRTPSESRPRQATSAEGGVDVQISERARAGAEAPQEQSDTYEDPRARRRS